MQRQKSIVCRLSGHHPTVTNAAWIQQHSLPSPSLKSAQTKENESDHVLRISLGLVQFVPPVHLAQKRSTLKPPRDNTVLNAKRIIYNLLLH